MNFLYTDEFFTCLHTYKEWKKTHCCKCNDKGNPNYSGKDTFAFFTAEQVTQLVGGESMS